MTAVAEQEWQHVEARKERLAAQAERNALMAGEQIAEALQKRKYPPSALVPSLWGKRRQSPRATWGRLNPT